ncbi:MAG TPA: hydrogenase formation protein HypD [Labilithrix sp.]|nr:hydrogenase formation protein HypD [Labilithrix sp.]
MKLIDEYRDRRVVQGLVRAIADESTRSHVLMEVCGGQTHAIVRYGLDEMLPAGVELLHGPGCPVCVTPVSVIDRAHAIASEPNVVFCSFGDMLRVPGSESDLLTLKAHGRDIRVVYSPLDAVALAARLPDKKVVFFAIGFETTAPATAAAVRLAKARGLSNFSLLVAHVLVPPMLSAILDTAGNRVEAFLGPGHVCTIMGTREYTPIATRYGVPIVVTGFEPVDLLAGILACIRQRERGEAKVEVPYARAVTEVGSVEAKKTLADVFEVCDRPWRGIGWIPKSGYRLAYEYRAFDAEHIFGVAGLGGREDPECISGRVLRGLAKPYECPAFGKRCTPERPLGATMVSSEGACAAYAAYGRATPKHALPIAKVDHA